MISTLNFVVLIIVVMALVQEFILSNLNSLVVTGGLLLVGQGFSTLSSRRRPRAQNHTRGVHVRLNDENRLKQSNIWLILFIALLSMCFSPLPSLKTAPASLAMPASHQEVAPPHITICSNQFPLILAPDFRKFHSSCQAAFYFPRSSVWWTVSGTSPPACR